MLTVTDIMLIAGDPQATAREQILADAVLVLHVDRDVLEGLRRVVTPLARPGELVTDTVTRIVAQFERCCTERHQAQQALQALRGDQNGR